LNNYIFFHLFKGSIPCGFKGFRGFDVTWQPPEIGKEIGGYPPEMGWLPPFFGVVTPLSGLVIWSKKWSDLFHVERKAGAFAPIRTAEKWKGV
jgi:hypothetical protein